MAEEKKEKKVNNMLRSMPCSLEAEQAVLGAIISDNEVAIRIVSDLDVDDFYAKNHQTIFNQIKKLTKENKPIDIVMLASSLERDDKLAEVGGVTTLDELIDSIPSTANVDYYVNILNQNSLRRRLIRECHGIVDKAYEDEDAEKVLAYAESQVYNISEKQDKSELMHVSNSTVEVMERIEKAYSENGVQGGLRIGYRNLDDLTNGFLPGQMIVLAARPGCGKTSFVMSMVANLASKQDSEEVVAVFNLEMAAGELVMRLISNIAGLDSRDLLGGLENKDNLAKVWGAQDILQKSNVYIDDTASITTEQIMSRCRRLKMQKGRLDLVIIDYLQLISSTDSKSTFERVTKISRDIKILAKELKVPIIILSQMSRKIEDRDREDKDPKLSDLRDSGAIEQDADIVGFLTDGDFNVDAGNTPIKLLIAKHRNGAAGDLYFEWDKSKMRFRPTIATRISPTAKTNEDGNMQSAGNVDIPLPDAPEESGDYGVGGVDVNDLY